MTAKQLFPLKGPVKRGPFAVVDLESKEHIETTRRHDKEAGRPETKGDRSQKGGFERPFLTGFYDGKDFISFKGDDCVRMMLTFLLSPRFDGYTFYAHNGGAFDWLHFLPMLAACGYSFEIMTVQSKIQCLRVKPHKDSKKKGWTFLDSYQLIPAKLEKIAKALQVEVRKQEGFDYDVHEDDERWIDYLEDDCVALYQTLVKFYEVVEKELGGEVGMTTAATSMKTFRRTYQEHVIERHEEHHEFFREAYYGGRVEIYKERCEGLHYYDINSSYPNAMLGPMPTGRAYKWTGFPAALVHANGTRIGFARAEVYVPEDTYMPVLPYRDSTNKLIFPVGRFSGVWPAVELFAAIEQGATVTWKESVWIDGEVIFEKMVHRLYKMRDKSLPGYDESLAYVAKILLNSLYGKFATNTLREKIVYVSEEEDPPDGCMPANPKDPDCPIYTIEEEIDAPYIAPQIAAHITALARLSLHKFMTEAEKHGMLAYCDTDSIVTTADLSHLVTTGLGNLKDEGEGVIYKGTFLQPKLYFLEGSDGSEKVVMKGYRTRTREAFETIKLGGTLKFETLEKIGAMTSKGFKEGPRMKTIEKCMRGEDTKRNHDEEGNTSPIVVDEFAEKMGELDLEPEESQSIDPD